MKAIKMITEGFTARQVYVLEQLQYLELTVPEIQKLIQIVIKNESN